MTILIFEIFSALFLILAIFFALLVVLQFLVYLVPQRIPSRRMLRYFGKLHQNINTSELAKNSEINLPMLIVKNLPFPQYAAISGSSFSIDAEAPLAPAIYYPFSREVRVKNIMKSRVSRRDIKLKQPARVLVSGENISRRELAIFGAGY